MVGFVCTVKFGLYDHFYWIVLSNTTIEYEIHSRLDQVTF
jgi:hypothetical protein